MLLSHQRDSSSTPRSSWQHLPAREQTHLGCWTEHTGMQDFLMSIARTLFIKSHAGSCDSSLVDEEEQMLLLLAWAMGHGQPSFCRGFESIWVPTSTVCSSSLKPSILSNCKPQMLITPGEQDETTFSSLPAQIHTFLSVLSARVRSYRIPFFKYLLKLLFPLFNEIFWCCSGSTNKC